MKTQGYYQRADIRRNEDVGLNDQSNTKISNSNSNPSVGGPKTCYYHRNAPKPKQSWWRAWARWIATSDASRLQGPEYSRKSWAYGLGFRLSVHVGLGLG